MAWWAEQHPTRPGHLLPVPRRPCPSHAARHRRAGRQSREGRRREGASEAEPVHHPGRWRQEREPRARTQGPHAGGVEELHHQHQRTDTGVRDRRRPPALAHREVLPDVQARPASPTDLPPQTRIDPSHLAVVFAALAVTHHIEAATGWSIKRFVQTARRYRTIDIHAGGHVLTAEEPLPADLRDALAQIT